MTPSEHPALAHGRAAFQLDLTSPAHGEPHWRAVHHNALRLLKRSGTPQLAGAAHALGWFAYMHDCCRVSDGLDPQHGPRAAELFDRLWTSGAVDLDRELFAQVHRAIERHSFGDTAGTLIERICWDADRLELPRVGTRPDPERLCTAAGREIASAVPVMLKAKDPWGLTMREAQVMAAMCDHGARQVAAAACGASSHTVDQHMKIARQKINTGHTITDLIAFDRWRTGRAS